MKKILLFISVAFLVASCATIKVTSDYDKTAPFAGYKTYAYTPEALALAVDELNRGRLIAAVDNELSLKGFTKSDKPDVLIDLKLAKEKIQTATATSSGGYGGYGYGYRYGWGGGFSTTSINYDSYDEGTLFVDMIDATKLQLVWQGRGVGTLNPDASADKREYNIKNAVKMIFEKYPPKIK
jgi:hypothetical protein